MFSADGGSRRALLLAWLKDLHAGRTAAGDVQRRLGMEPARAGALIVAWCRALMR